LSVYAESSAVLAWILGERAGARCERVLAQEDAVYASEMTLIECDRALIRAAHLGDVSQADAERWRAQVANASAHWILLVVSEDVVTRARTTFPVEPVRTLDAIHLSSALIARPASPGMRLLSLDERVRRNGEALGFEVAP